MDQEHANRGRTVEPVPDHWFTAYEEAAVEWPSRRWRPVPAAWFNEYEDAAVAATALLSQGSWHTGPSSIMEVIGLSKLEVPHSTVLAWLLTPTGGHRHSTAALDAFLRLLDLHPSQEESRRARVVPEKWIWDEERARAGRIDIVIEVGSHRVVVETKMNADETDDQLDRYARAYSRKDDHLVFLTRDGRRPDRRRSSRTRWQPMRWREVARAFDDVVQREAALGSPPHALGDYVRTLQEAVR